MVKLAANFYFPSADSLNVPTIFQDINTTLPHLWNVAVELAAVIFIVLLLVGGIQYLANAGNEDAAKKSMKLILDAVIGLVLVLIAWPAGLFVLNLLGQGQSFQGSDQVNDIGISNPGGTSTTGGNAGAVQQQVNATVRLQRENGEPAANITIHAEPEPQSQGDNSEQVGFDNLLPTAYAATTQQMRTARTNQNGEATFTDLESGNWTIFIDKDREKLGTIYISPEETPELYDSNSNNASEIKWTFHISEKLRQVVVSVLPNNGSGERMKNFPLRLWRQSGSLGKTYYNTYYTDATTGRAEIELPEGAEMILTDPLDAAELARYNVPERDGLSWTVFITAAKIVGHHFYFVDGSGAPAKNVPVKIREVGIDKILIATTTPADGRVTVSVAPGTSLYAVASGQQVCEVTVIQASEATRCNVSGVPVGEPILDSTEYTPPPAG